MGHGDRVEVGPLGMLAFTLVRVLVATQSLGGGEVTAAVMALEFSVGFFGLVVLCITVRISVRWWGVGGGGG